MDRRIQAETSYSMSWIETHNGDEYSMSYQQWDDNAWEWFVFRIYTNKTGDICWLLVAPPFNAPKPATRDLAFQETQEAIAEYLNSERYISHNQHLASGGE